MVLKGIYLGRKDVELVLLGRYSLGYYGTMEKQNGHHSITTGYVLQDT